MLMQEKKKYIIRLWPRTANRQSAGQDLVAELNTLRERISAAWKPGKSAVEEIRGQRTKSYQVYNASD